MTRVLPASLAMMLVCAPVQAQSRPGQNIQAQVRVWSITRSLDTTVIQYRVGVARSSAEKLNSLTLNGTGVTFTVLSPLPTDDWMVATAWRGRAVARWRTLELVSPGDSTPLLVVKAVGLPGITDGWIRGDRLPDQEEADSIEQSIAEMLPDGVFDPLDVYGLKLPMVGIDPYPTASLAAYASRLKSLSSAACLNGWITNPTLCSNLNGLMTGTAQVLGHLAAVEAGHTAGHMNSLAYWTLKVNGEATRDLRDPTLVELRYLCGNRFRIRNRNYVPVTVTYRRAGSPGTGTVTLAGRASDAAGPVETTITLPSAGTVELLHDGTVFRTQGNDGVRCP